LYYGISFRVYNILDAAARKVKLSNDLLPVI